MANVVELKVGLHCDECIKKILKAIKKIEVSNHFDSSAAGCSYLISDRSSERIFAGLCCCVVVEMNELKSNDDTLDRLSALPDSLILEILSFLEMRDVVKTTLLSKRWNYLWITIPCLEFDEGESNAVQFRNFVNRTLMLWRGMHLRKFSIITYGSNELDEDANLWIRFAKERKVEELEISSFSLSQCLYECSSIRKLWMFNCFLQTCENVQWDHLNSLNLSDCFFSEHWMNQVFSSTPQLETFSYRNDQGNDESENLSIRSSSLKKLSIDTSHDESFVLTIWAPNLEVLEFSGRPCSGYLLTNIASLTKVYIGLKGYYLSPARFEEALSQILPAIQHVVTVTLSADCFKMLGVMKDKYSISPLSKVKLLKIESGVAELSELLRLLEFFPKLKMLIVDWNSLRFKFNADKTIMSEANILHSNLLLLSTVKIYLSWYNESTFQFIEFLLKHAAMMEKIVIHMTKSGLDNSEDMILAAQNVACLQRSFPSVELIIC